MNKAITDGITFMPPPFANGLDVWSSENGTPGSDTYDGAANAAFVPADQDFGGALEVQKVQGTQKLRYMGETPILPGCYLQITARVKAVSGSLPNVRIAGWAGGAGGTHVTGLTETGPSVTLTNYGDVFEVTAIVGSGDRGGVDMVWGTEPLYGHFGIDLTGPNGGVVRIDDLRIEDVTGVFLRDIIGLVDVRDYGAKGDGSTDDLPAFEAADAAANGRTVLVPAGTYYLADSLTMQSKVSFEGEVTMPVDKIFELVNDFDFSKYVDAFGGDTEMAFMKAYQALLNNPGHVELDMKGRKVALREPVDMQAAVPNRTTYKTRHVIKNAQFSVFPGPNWDTDTVTSQATYNANDNKRLTNVANVANIQVGSLVTGNGVGREVYVRAKNVGAQTVTLSQPLYDAEGTQNYTFKRFKYMWDFSGFAQVSKFAVSNIEFQCGGDCSAVLLPPAGSAIHFRDCFFTQPRDRGITSHGEGDQGMMIDRCQFLSRESPLLVPDRTTIGVNCNGNDIKIRNCRCNFFKHFAILAGSSSIIMGNHCFQGDSADPGPRSAIFVLARTNNRGTITGNYICDGSVEWTNEYDEAPDFSSEFSFSALSITSNVFLSQSTAPSFNFLIVKPYGPGHFINGLTVTGNTVRLIDGPIDRFEGIDTSFATLNFERFRNIRFEDNAYFNVNIQVENPLVLQHTEASAQKTWVVAPHPKLPFEAWAQTVEAIVPEGPIREANGDAYFGIPYYDGKEGPNKDQVNLRWEKAVSGTVTMRVRIDDLI
ncbi:glycosyl hydrolase family 28-related protein [Roseovarius atlanticus]|uniref:glycosyl hydrolase family 28-related protein n=1 Tax=Roseovarius atlanticus TaxID=1641875 RepID=UPI001C98BB51|nr:glycosyl hydrolase family 28-related protein [Roseovarius atlanticus]MBY5988061.1 glycoside hydrolase family 55 protein [Roseovarius atlanticus]MBY6123452.1 glycoside hydrolase family 55 protein [Roseovarius atlanticus]MBY6147947.1 glycoside hydrolase family 55 protein [Roseovarius atlanticus]